MKGVGICIWLAILIAGAFIYKYISNDYQYLFGYAVGAFSELAILTFEKSKED